jgi:hypothetical protein
VVWHGVVLADVEVGVDGLGSTTRGVNVIRGANGLEVRAADGGERPAPPSSVEPSGIPTRPTDDTELIPPPDDGPANELLPIEAQAPDAVPVMPPPSNIDVSDVSAVDVPVLEDVPVIELPTVPKDVCGIEPPMPEHVVALPVVAPIGDAPDIVGLTPGDASSVAPKGVPVGATGEPGPMPSGDVMPSGELGEILIPPTCAKAEPQLKRTAAVVAIIKRVIVGSISSCIGLRGHWTSWCAARRPYPKT